ncbi:MAG TPA: hypothetical protein VFH83_02905 [Spirochaetia bacterium]|nr:hypothetical protein [Spirochaetia bacterium]
MGAETVPFHTIPPAPAAVSAGTILGRLADAIGFRFRWASEGLTDADLPYKPAPDCMSTGEQLDHICDLLATVSRNVGAPPLPPLAQPATCAPLRARILEISADLSARFKGMSDGDLSGRTPPLWNMVNGPMADCLTHIGQILSWRRLAGAPPAAADVFRGLPPKGL